MTINAVTFAAWMQVLADRFNRPMQPATQQAYYATLSDELSTEEFERAAALAFRDETFWPSPRAIIEKVHPPVDIKVSATETFEGLRQAITDFGWQHVHRRLEPTLPLTTRRALQGSGGVYAIAMASYTELPHLARKFADIYEAAVAEIPVAALPGMTEAMRIGQSRPKLLREDNAS